MASNAPKVRIVRCPKCFKLLPELAGISVYQCGKCGAILTAKKRKEDLQSANSDTLQNLAQKTEHDDDSEDKDSTCSSQKALSCSTDESEQVEHQDFAKVNKSSSRRTSNGSTSSDALHWRENGSSSSVAGGSGKGGDRGRGSKLENPSSTGEGTSGGSDSSSDAQKPLKFNASSLREELEISEKIVRRYADLIRSKSPVRIAEATKSSIISADDRVNNKLQGRLEDPEPSATKTFHAYEGSISSNSDSGDQVSDLHSPQSKESSSGPQQAAEPISAGTGNIRDDVSENRTIDPEPEVQNEVLSWMSSNEKHGSVADDTSISEDNMVTDKHRGQLASSEPLVTKFFHSYRDSASRNGWGDQEPHFHRPKKSSLGSQSGEELITATDGDIRGEVLVDNMIDTESEVQNQEKEFTLMSVDKKRGLVTDDSIVPEDDMITDKHRGELGVSNPSGTSTLNACNDSISSSDGCSDKDLHSHQSEKSFPKSRGVKKVVSTDEKAIRKDTPVDNMIDTGLEVQNKVRSLPLVSENEKHGQLNGGGATSEDDIIGSKLGGVLGVAKPSATKAFHAYDSSISSTDGWYDQASDVHSHQPRESFDESHRVAELVSTKEEVIKDGVSVDNTMSSESEVRNQDRKASLKSVNEMYHPTILGDANPPEDETAENTRYLFHNQMDANVPSFKSVQTSFKSTLSWLEEERNGLRRTQHFDQRVYENRNFPPPQKLDAVERHQMEILRKVDELSDQLNRSYAQTRNMNERFPLKGNQHQRQHPLHYKNQSLPDPDMSHQYGTDFPRRAHGTYKPSKSMPFQHGYPLSGNVTNYRNPANCTCACVYPQDLLQANAHYSEGQCRAYPDHVCYSLYNSGPSSPEQHLHTHHPLRSCEVCTVPRDHTDRTQNVENLRRRERRQSVKKHCRPIAGGAPFINCYNCNKFLYLPADSFLSSTRRHQLQCGSCNKVLVFSLLRGTHVAPYYQEKVVHAPSDINSSRGSNSTMNSVFRPRTSDHHKDPWDYSEEAGSTNGESADRKTRANKHGKRQVYDSGSPSYNEAESAREGGVATLHELMGYSTVSRILKASDAL